MKAGAGCRPSGLSKETVLIAGDHPPKFTPRRNGGGAQTPDRGVTMRSIGDGGEQERQLAQQYRLWQNALSIRWLVTSGLLGRIAADFDRDAVRMDVDDRQRH